MISSIRGLFGSGCFLTASASTSPPEVLVPVPVPPDSASSSSYSSPLSSTWTVTFRKFYRIIFVFSKQPDSFQQLSIRNKRQTQGHNNLYRIPKTMKSCNKNGASIKILPTFIRIEITLQDVSALEQLQSRHVQFSKFPLAHPFLWCPWTLVNSLLSTLLPAPLLGLLKYFVLNGP